jgi:hypothetical protein
MMLPVSNRSLVSSNGELMALICVHSPHTGWKQVSYSRLTQ